MLDLEADPTLPATVVPVEATGIPFIFGFWKPTRLTPRPVPSRATRPALGPFVRGARARPNPASLCKSARLPDQTHQP